jgi:ferredoxin
MNSKPFNPFIAAIWRRLAETLLAEPDAMQISAQQVVDNLQAMFANIAGPKPRETALAVLACWIVLGGPLWHFAPRHLRIRRIERRLKNARVDLFQDMARIRGIVYAGYYGHWLPAAAPGDAAEQEANATNPVLASIGFVLPRHRERAGTADDPGIALHTANDLPHSVFLGAEAVPDRVEVVVIGSGAGGAVAAANLADQGYEVLVIEAGPYLASTAITPHELRMSSSLFKDGAIQTTRDRDIIVFQGRAVGGSTVINNGICLRLDAPGETHPDAPDVLASWAALGAPIPADELAAAYARIEARLGIHTIDHRLGRSNGTRLLAAWQAYRAATADPDPLDARATCGWFRKNWGAKHAPNACLSCGYCNTGCPYGRKNAMPESFLAHATRHAARKARILPEAEVRTARGRGAHHCLGRARRGRAPGRKRGAGGVCRRAGQVDRRQPRGGGGRGGDRLVQPACRQRHRRHRARHLAQHRLPRAGAHGRGGARLGRGPDGHLYRPRRLSH